MDGQADGCPPPGLAVPVPHTSLGGGSPGRGLLAALGQFPARFPSSLHRPCRNSPASSGRLQLPRHLLHCPIIERKIKKPRLPKKKARLVFPAS